MSDEASEVSGEAQEADAAHGAVIVGVVPDLPARVLKEGARYALLLGVPLLVVHVDVTRFVTYEDPDGYVHSAPIDMNIAVGEGELARVEAQAAAILDGHGVDWSVRQLVGDPALAIKHLADEIDARLLVVGTRKPASANPSASSSPARSRRGWRIVSTGRSSSSRSGSPCRTTRRSGRPETA